MINLSQLELTRPVTDLHIVDKHNEKTGLVFRIRPSTADEYQKALRKSQDRYSSGKKVSVKERRQLLDMILLARIDGWAWSGQAREKLGEPEFSPANLKAVLFENGEHSAAIRNQINEIVGNEEELFTEGE